MDGDDGTNAQYVTSSSIRKTFGVSNTTLRNWAESGRVRVVRVGGDTGKRLYLKSDIQREFAGFKPRNEEGKAVAAAASKKKKVCYARVSSAKQKDDLERQVEALKAQFPEHEIVTDIASGLNWKRPGFLRVLDQASEGAITEIVVAARDRLCRFAFELVQHVVKKNGCKLVVLNQGDGSSSSTNPGSEEAQASELKDDLLAIVTCFVASNNGKRAAAHRRAKREREAREREQAAQASDDEGAQSEESEDGEREPDTSTPKESKCRKRWIFPTASQKKTIKLWLDGARFAYNLGVDVVNKTHRWGRKKVREGAAVQNGKWEEKAPTHLWKVPYMIRGSALLDVCKACAALKAKEKSVHRKLKHRSSSDRRQSVAVERAWVNKPSRSILAGVFGTTSDRSVMKMEGGKHLPHVFKHDFRLGYERVTKRYYVSIPTDVRVLPQKSSKGGIVAIDPGVRTFATCYDPAAKTVTMFGNIGGRKDGKHNGTELLGWLSRKSDRLTAKAKKTRGRHRYRIKKAAARIRQRISDLVDYLG